MNLQIEHLKGKTDLLQKKLGHPDYRAIYGTGCITQPDVCLILMNPTARNVSVHKQWKGLRASWLGTKNIWKLLYQLGFLDKQTFTATQDKKPRDWDDAFARSLYTKLAEKKVFLTNLGRSTQPDARPLPNSVFAACAPLMEEEIDFIRPNVVITFGNQVSSVLLQRPIKVSEVRRKPFELKTKGGVYTTYATYYPVGMGIMNMGKAAEDIKWILSKHSIKELPAKLRA
ncbi:MAG: uracil-DNA glycosylase family protein [bacterium]